MDEESPPSVHVRWFQIEVSELLSTVPLVLNSSPTWRPLTREESDACEAAWIKHRSKKKEARQLSSNAKVSKSENEAVDDGAETTRSVSPLPVPPGMTSCSPKYALYVSLKNRLLYVNAEQIEESDDDDFMGVPIEREKLFEVDVRTMRVGASVSSIFEVLILFSNYHPELSWALGSTYLLAGKWACY